ncbi:unnamed protein product [Ectocarpus sp. CCAP 1310/34]|nr:unnamed protein product [Ectocarpus sp. CCAP 1310/34]
MARSEALRLRLASVGTIKDETDANKDIARGLPSSLYAVQKGILLADDVLTLRTLETVVRDAHVEMERERSKGERREVELALAASGMGRRGGGSGGASGGQDGGHAAAGGQNRDGEKKNSDMFNDEPGGFCRYHQSELHTNEQCRLQQQLRRARSREGAAERRSGGGSRGGGGSQRGGRPPPGPGRGGGRWVRLQEQQRHTGHGGDGWSQASPPLRPLRGRGPVGVWGVTRGVVGPRDATAAMGVPRENRQGEARGTRSGHGREQAYVVYYAHDDGGYYDDYGDYDDGYYYEDGYHDAGYAYYAGGRDSYSYSSGSQQ